MTVFHLDGFDSYAIAADLSMEYTDDNLNFSTTGGRFGGGTFETTDNNRTFTQKTIPYAGLTQFYTGFAMSVATSINTDQAILTIVSSAGDETTITLNTSSGVFKCWSGDQESTFGGTSTSFTVGTNVWHWVEFYFLLSTSVGVVEIWVDDTQLLSISGQDTAYAGGTSIIALAIGTPHNTSSCRAYFDDWYIIDPTSTPNNVRLGDSRVQTVVPTSDAGPNDGTPSTGDDHFACVDEAQWSSSKYITLANTANQEEIFGVGALGSTPSNIWALRALNVAEETDAGGVTAQAVIRSGSASSLGASTSLLTSYAHIYTIANVDPATSTQWTVSGVNAVNIGFTVTS